MTPYVGCENDFIVLVLLLVAPAPRELVLFQNFGDFGGLKAAQNVFSVMELVYGMVADRNGLPPYAL